MNAYRIGKQWVDLDHILTVSDPWIGADATLSFNIQFMFRSTIYVLSVLGARKFMIKIYFPEGNTPQPVDVVVTLIPLLNTVFSVVWVFFDRDFINWYFNRKK